MDAFRAILLPGSVLPANLAYAALIEALGAGTEAVAKELEVYATRQPPPDYSLDLEVAGVLREADERGWQRFHLVGYSGGGASALAVAAHHPGSGSTRGGLRSGCAGARRRSPVPRVHSGTACCAATPFPPIVGADTAGPPTKGHG